MPERHVPLRSCVICGTKTAKRELTRVVRIPSGACLVDTTGKLSGRGAYLCSDPECWDRALNRGRLAHALRAEISDEDRERLTAHGAGLTAA